jgi:CheY-like chemotaxis protein
VDRRATTSSNKLVAGPPDARPRRILLVEDNADVRDMMTTALAGQGHVVDQAALPDECLALLRQRPYELLVAHYNLPGKTAAVMLKEAAEEGLLKETPTLVVTADPDPQGIDVASLVRKPLDLTRFLLQVQRIFSADPDPTAAPAVAPGVAPVARPPVELVLYVDRVWVTSARARENIEKILEGFVRSQVALRVCDVAEDALSTEEDQVVFTPTLVKRSPPPRAWVVGDLSDHAVVASLLDMSGVSRR